MPDSIAILDANLALYTLIISEYTPRAFALVERLRVDEIKPFAPRLWLYEVISGINKYHYARMITLEEAHTAINAAYKLGINLVDDSPEISRAALRWANQLGQMAAYDGFYLAVAEKLAAPLWTGDRRLANAAQQAGIDWVHWMGDFSA